MIEKQNEDMIPKKMHPRAKANRESRRLGKKWYGVAHYRERQPFETFLKREIAPGIIRRDPRAFETLQERIGELVPRPEKAMALEIGPGDTPVITDIPFHRRIFLELSNVLAKNVQRLPKGTQGSHHTIIGDTRKLPFSPDARFSVVVMNEVLTHIHPSERIKVLQRLMEISNGMIVVDSPQLSISNLVQRYKKARRPVPTSSQLRTVQATSVRFQPLIRFLNKSGWTVKVEVYQNYLLMTAKRNH